MAGPPEQEKQRVGVAWAPDRAVPWYVGRREPEVHPRGSVWIAIAVLAVLILVFILGPFLWFAFLR